MDIRIGYKRDYVTYGTVVSLMLDYSPSNEIATISNVPEKCENKISQNNIANFMELLTSKEFLFTHGVFNEYCFLHKFKNIKDFRDGYLNTAFIVLPAFEFESMDNLNKLIKKAQKTGIVDFDGNDEVSKKQILDNYKKFIQEIQTNHDKSLKLMKKDNNRVNYYDCFQLMHLKSGNFLEYKRNKKDLMTYIQLSSSMSKRTLFRFIPSFEYQTENSTKVFFFLSVQIACGEKRNNREKYMSSKGSIRVSKNKEEKINDKEKEEKDLLSEKSIFNGEDLKNIIKDVYQESIEEEKIIDEFVTYSINDNLFQKNFGSNLMPEDDNIIMVHKQICFWRLINLSEDYFEDVKYLNLFDNFCIQSPDKNLFINLSTGENEGQNYSLLGDNAYDSKNELKPAMEENEKENDKNEIKEENNIINSKVNKNFLNVDPGYIPKKNISNSSPSFFDINSINSINNINNINDVNNINEIQLDYYYETDLISNNQSKLKVESYDDKEHLKPYSLFRFEPINEHFEKGEYGFGSLAKFCIIDEGVPVRIQRPSSEGHWRQSHLPEA